MAKTLIVGDTHLKHEIILPRVDEAAKRAGADRIVFLGDYCDEWRASGRLLVSALEFFSEWVGRTRRAGLEVDLLLGNHDFAYLLGSKGPGTNIHLVHDVRDLLLPLQPSIAATVDGFLLTHAGVTQTWADRFLDDPGDAASARDQLDAMYERGRLDELYACGPARGGLSVPGPLWADQRELWADAPHGFSQIVGHTPVRTCTQEKSAASLSYGAGTCLWFCDTFSLASGLQPIGDASMLLVEDGEARAVGQGNGVEVPFWEDAVDGWKR